MDCCRAQAACAACCGGALRRRLGHDPRLEGLPWAGLHTLMLYVYRAAPCLHTRPLPPGPYVWHSACSTRPACTQAICLTLAAMHVRLRSGRMRLRCPRTPPKPFPHPALPPPPDRLSALPSVQLPRELRTPARGTLEATPRRKGRRLGGDAWAACEGGAPPWREFMLGLRARFQPSLAASGASCSANGQARSRVGLHQQVSRCTSTNGMGSPCSPRCDDAYNLLVSLTFW